MIPMLVILLCIAGALAVWAWRLRSALRAAHGHSDVLRQQLARVVERPDIAAQERQRLLSDLHDDIGGKLLTLVHTLERPEQADLVRAVIQDFRDVVSRSRLEACTLLEALGQIRDETGQRLDAMGGTLDWQQHADIPDPSLDEAHVLHLFRIAREALTNALRHGHATHIRMRVGMAGDRLLLDVTDNGPGFVRDPASGGRGTVSMRNRAQELSGTIDWRPGTQGGTKVVLEFPLPADAASPPAKTRRP
ncbi:histidine kinase/DNA gyrase B/HSP90-like ATPase [Panacagrimonas perspica]|uniref:histidine kinase n=2 Tax=Panacagrimonas perspica TaxID=381431 RepID=A0A4R7NX55_9GAMM|nr:histidine kinase/DNA gyrase B/HSP90-like ATPase [Panacagrimonas perspica]